MKQEAQGPVVTSDDCIELEDLQLALIGGGIGNTIPV
jgi:hypothetical protein